MYSGTRKVKAGRSFHSGMHMVRAMVRRWCRVCFPKRIRMEMAQEAGFKPDRYKKTRRRLIESQRLGFLSVGMSHSGRSTLTAITGAETDHGPPDTEYEHERSSIRAVSYAGRCHSIDAHSGHIHHGRNLILTLPFPTNMG
jgi:hypothetical protein